MELARSYIPRWFQLQVEHYAADEKLYGNVPSYASFSATFKQRIANCNPDNLGRLFEVSLIGSAETVRERLQRFLDVGYNYVMVQPSLPGLPHRHPPGLADALRPRRDALFRGAAAHPEAAWAEPRGADRARGSGRCPA